jgi:hypothetical protein
MGLTPLLLMATCRSWSATSLEHHRRGRQAREPAADRAPPPSDRRAKQLILTPGGTELRERLLELLSGESPMAGLTQQEQGVLQDLLQRAISRR